MNTQEFFTHLELAALLDVSVTTIKSYRRKFPGCIPVANLGKPIRFSAAARDVCLRIRDLFATGMSVPEVRARLTTDFDWIPEPEAAESAPEQELNQVAHVELPPLYTSAMSDMAQSLVGIAQKQGAVLTRLEELGDAPQPAAPGEVPQRPAWLDEFSALFGRMDDRLQRLESGLDRLAGLVDRLNPQSELPQTPVSVQPPQSSGRQPDRAFLGQALVAAGADGLLRGIAGPGRGRFTCADIKALAACPVAPERACHLEWSEYGADWRLALRSRGGDTPAVALLREVSDSAGNTAVLIHHLLLQGEEREPVELLHFLRDLAQA